LNATWFDVSPTRAHGWYGDSGFAFHASLLPTGKYGWQVWRTPHEPLSPLQAFGEDATSLDEAKAQAEASAEELVEWTAKEVKP
jgi:hypothetical protein